MKKTESLTIRCTPEMKEELKKIAAEKKWTISQTASLIIEWYINNKNESIKL